ncbi:MAG: hypothetical protein EBR82_25180 [Caulobacteraceae bacterium]|nr:hypothetical protein [Caulobacteraceae bacterium]
MAITLGKDCTISLDGGTILSARNVTLTESARTIDVNPYGSRYAGVYSTGYECTVSVELNDSADLGTAFLQMHTGGTFNVVGGAGGFSFLAVLTGISESDPIDGVATFVLEGKMTDPNLQR